VTKIDLKKLYKSKVAATRGLVAIVSIAAGILVTAQMRSLPERVVNPIAPYASLKETKEALYEEQNDLNNNIADLQNTLETTQKETLQLTLTKEELSALKNKKAQVGLTKLNGPGVIVVLDDSKGGPATEDSIVHASDLRDIVNLLWGSGAEAISINNQRVVVNTAIDCIVNTIMVNNVKITSSFRVEAIGDQKLMYEKLINQSFLTNIHQRQKVEGLVFEITKNNDITVPIFNGSFSTSQGA